MTRLSNTVLPRNLRGAPVEIVGAEGRGIRVKLLEGRGIWPEGLTFTMKASTVIDDPEDEA
jgi:hypothetical protein